MKRTKLTRTILLAAALTATSTLPAEALTLIETCYQPGLTAGCMYVVEYNDGTSSTQYADSAGRVTRPCQKIITRVTLVSNQGGCTRTAYESNVEC
jgi:hypothetical protein